MPSTSEDYMRRVQALIDKAAATNFEGEAKSLLAKADELILKYSLDPNAILDPSRPNTARPVFDAEPIRRDVVIFDGTQDMDHAMVQALYQLFRACADHMFVRMPAYSMSQGKGIVFGYEIDINFLEMFFMKLKLHMFSNLIVTVDSNEPWVKVLTGLKNMGYKWEHIHYRLQEHEHYPYRGMPWERRFGVAFTNKVKQYTEENNLPRNKSSNPNAWRADFIEGYVTKICYRLMEMRAASLEDNKLLPDLIAGKKSKVQEAFYDMFPDMRPEGPHPAECECDRCHYRKCKDLNCKRPYCRMMRKPVRASKVYYRNTNHDAYAAGQRVASTADLTDKGAIK